ncbi:DUF2294 domain-containing protein [Egbenema bharatensis]|uniref:DUF2294 domain-containing protein n=1 Tax=Egbenema bharatensis TaxID=3463334 RepID=UPI003A845397
MTASLPTRGQLERALSQRIQALYREQLGHRTGKVTCQIFGEQLAIVIENSITQPEQMLAQAEQNDLASEVRSGLDNAIQPQLIRLIEEIAGVTVVDLLSDATLESGRTGIIAILDNMPTVRCSNSRKSQDSSLDPDSDGANPDSDGAQNAEMQNAGQQ